MLSGIYNACCYNNKENTSLNKCVEDPRLRPSGMTPNLKGFTLIELLVVVLIIGILAAVAVPQYTFAVEKARLSEALTMVKSLEKAIDVWLLEHGTPTQPIDFLGNNANGKGQLDIDIESGMDCSIDGGKKCSNKNFVYSAYCTKNGSCVTRVIRSNSSYGFYRIRTDSSWSGDECDYYPDESPVGEKICKMLEAQGDGYTACEDC